jgi:drug/metabolite transporter (DMT)-like permease
MTSQAPPKPASPHKIALLLGLIGSVLYGTVPYFSVSLYKSGLNAESILFLRYWSGLSVIAPIVFLSGRRGPQPSLASAFLIGFTAAVLGTAYILLYFEALYRIPSSIAILLFFTYPMLTLVLERLVFKTPVPPAMAAAAILIAIGSGLTVGKLAGFSDISGLGLLMGLLAPLIFSIYLQIVSPHLRKISAWTGAALIYAGLGTGFLAAVAMAGLRLPPDAASWLNFGAIVVVGSALPIAAFAYSMPRLGPTAYGIIASTEVITVTAIGVLFLDEALSTFQICGAAFVLAGIILSRIPSEKLQKTRLAWFQGP